MFIHILLWAPTARPPAPPPSEGSLPEQNQAQAQTSASLTSTTEPHVIKAHSDSNIFQSRTSPENGTRIIHLLLIYLLTKQANAKSILLCAIVAELQQKQTRSPLYAGKWFLFISVIPLKQCIIKEVIITTLNTVG